MGVYDFACTWVDKQTRTTLYSDYIHIYLGFFELPPFFFSTNPNDFIALLFQTKTLKNGGKQEKNY